MIYTLELDGAEILIDLGDPAVSQPPFASGEAVLWPRDPEHGARFVAAVVRWLGESDPPLGNGHPGPWKLRYSLMSATPAWSVYKLLLVDEQGEADLILRTHSDGKRVELLKREGDNHSELARLLALALRDGPEVDAWIPRSTALRGSDGLLSVRWCGTGILGVAETADGFSVRRWKDLRGQPEVVVSAPGRPRQLLPDPTCTRAVLAIDYPRQPDTYDTADPTEIALIDLAEQTLSILSGRDETWSLQEAAWSPDGSQVALTTLHRALSPPFPGVTRVYAARTGQAIATSEPEWDAMPWRWDDQGLILRADPFNRGDDRPAWYRWAITEPATPSPAPTLTSPDGTQTLELTTIEGIDPYLARWVGPHHVLWVGDTAQVRDLTDASDRPLHVLGGVVGMDIDGAGSRIALLTEKGVRWASTTR